MASQIRVRDVVVGDGTASGTPMLRVYDVVASEQDGMAELVFTLSAPATQRASVTWTLGAELERLTLSGSAISGTGNTLPNLIGGTSAGNRLSGADQFVVDSLVGSDTVTDFKSGTDRIVLRSTVVRVGDGDPLLEGAMIITGPGGFMPFSELVVVTKNIAGAITAASAAAAIGQAAAPYLPGQSTLFAVDKGSQSAAVPVQVARCRCARRGLRADAGDHDDGHAGDDGHR